MVRIGLGWSCACVRNKKNLVLIFSKIRREGGRLVVAKHRFSHQILADHDIFNIF